MSDNQVFHGTDYGAYCGLTTSHKQNNLFWQTPASREVPGPLLRATNFGEEFVSFQVTPHTERTGVTRNAVNHLRKFVSRSRTLVTTWPSQDGKNTTAFNTQRHIRRKAVAQPATNAKNIMLVYTSSAHIRHNWGRPNSIYIEKFICSLQWNITVVNILNQGHLHERFTITT